MKYRRKRNKKEKIQQVRERERKTNVKKKGNSKALARRDSGAIFSIFQRDGYRVKFNAISRYIIPIILSRVIAYWTYGRAFIFRPLVPASVGSVIALFRARQLLIEYRYSLNKQKLPLKLELSSRSVGPAFFATVVLHSAATRSCSM